jgi:hypothetical protein
MGIYDENDSDDEFDVEADFDKRQEIGGYLAYHARKQLAFDLWWLVLAVFVSQYLSSAICVIS